MQAETSSSAATEDKRELSQYGCGSESTFGPLSEAGGEKTASSFTSGPGCREAGLAAHSTPARGKAVSAATTPQSQGSNSPAAGAASGLKKSTSFSDRFSTFFKELIAPKKPARAGGGAPGDASPANAATPVRGGSASPPQGAKKAVPSHADPGAMEPNRQSLLFRVYATVEHTRQHKMLHAVADLLEKEREASRIRNLVRSWLTTASATKPPHACASPRTPLGPPTQRTPTGSLIQASPPNNSGNAAGKADSSPSPLKVVPFSATVARDSSDVFSESREATIDSESSPAVRDLLDSLPSMTLTEEEIARRALRTRLFDFYERYDPLHVPSEAAVDAVLAARIPEHVLFHFLQSKYGLLPPASPSPKRASAADAASELTKAASFHHSVDPAILDPGVWEPSWSALLAPFVPHADFQPLVWTAAAKLSTIDRFKRLPPYFMHSDGDKCQVFMFEGYPIVLNHTKRTARFPALPSAENMFDLPSDCVAELDAHTPPVPDTNSCLSYAVPRQWVRRKDTRDPLAFRGTAARPEKSSIDASNDRDESASAASDLGAAPLGEFNAWF